MEYMVYWCYIRWTDISCRVHPHLNAIIVIWTRTCNSRSTLCSAKSNHSHSNRCSDLLRKIKLTELFEQTLQWFSRITKLMENFLNRLYNYFEQIVLVCKSEQHPIRPPKYKIRLMFLKTRPYNSKSDFQNITYKSSNNNRIISCLITPISLSNRNHTA